MTIKIKVGDLAQDEGLKMSLNMRKTLDGNIIIRDHIDIDIVVMPEQKKIVAFAKRSYQDNIYSIQERLFNFLGEKGVIKRESVRSGNVYGSLESEIPESADGSVSPIQMAVFSIGKFLEEEIPYMETERYIGNEFEKRMTDPDEEESTELGEIPQRAKQGSIPSKLDPYKSRRYHVSWVY